MVGTKIACTKLVYFSEALGLVWSHRPFMGRHGPSAGEQVLLVRLSGITQETSSALRSEFATHTL